MTRNSVYFALLIFIINIPLAFMLLFGGLAMAAIVVITTGTLIIWAIALGIISL
jgi:hypothetical protein